MATNPYETPVQVETKTDEERAAERRIAPVAMGMQVSGVLALLTTLFSVVGLAIMGYVWWQHVAETGELFPPPEVEYEGPRGIAVTVGSLLLGLLAFYAGHRLRRLDSKPWACGACILGIVFYPVCIVTLPLCIYGAFVLSRADVQAVLRQRTALRKSERGRG